MSEEHAPIEPQAEPGDRPHEPARVRPRRWLSWVWLAPVIAATVVLWLAWRGLAERGPQITLDFKDASALTPGQTSIRYKGVEVGRVEAIELTRDMSHVVVHARMVRTVEPYLADGARFWIVQPRVGAQGITGLATLISGAYIEMFPGSGAAQRHFIGLAEPPLLQPDTQGRSFTLLTPDVSALLPGAPLTYHGLDVGEIEGSELTATERQVRVFAFIRAPYDRLVHAQTRFWTEGGIDLTAGSQGLRVQLSSWQQLLAGGVAFETPSWAIKSAPSPSNAHFELYASRSEAFRYPSGTPLFYHVAFTRNAGGIGPGSVVELEGTEIGEVTQTRLVYDPRQRALYTEATLALDPSVVSVPGIPASEPEAHAAAVGAGLARLVAQGLRAQILSASLLTGQKLVSLDMVSGTTPARIRTIAGIAELPSAPATDINEILGELQSTVHHLDQATAGPQLRQALTELDETLSHLDRMSQALEPQTQALLASLRATSEAAQRTADAAGALLGANGRGSLDLPGMTREMTDAARSIRDLADFLSRHPEAILRGRTPRSD